MWRWRWAEAVALNEKMKVRHLEMKRFECGEIQLLFVVLLKWFSINNKVRVKVHYDNYFRNKRNRSKNVKNVFFSATTKKRCKWGFNLIKPNIQWPFVATKFKFVSKNLPNSNREISGSEMSWSRINTAHAHTWKTHN